MIGKKYDTKPDTKRAQEFDRLYKAIILIVDRYIHSSSGNDSDWQQPAIAFGIELEQVILPKRSLLKLFEKTKTFAGTLRGKVNYVASFIFADRTLEDFGSGSSLKSKLETLLKTCDPYSFDYINDEVKTAKREEQRRQRYTPIMQSVSLTFLQYLSDDSKEILSRAVADKTLYKSLHDSSLLKQEGFLFMTLIKEMKEHIEENKKEEQGSSLLSYIFKYK